MISARWRQAFLWIGLAAIPVGSFAITYFDMLPLGLRRADPAQYRPNYLRPNGAQLVLVYMGAKTCAWSHQPGARVLLDNMKLELARRARQHGWSFLAIGVSLDWRPEDSIDHLRELGHFDEIAVGNNWSNELALRFLGDRVPEPESTPQILLMRRDVIRPDFRSSFNYRIEHERIVWRASGDLEIRRWVRNGMPLVDPLAPT